MTTSLADDLGALGVKPIDRPSDPPDHSPTTPDASCASWAEEPPVRKRSWTRSRRANPRRRSCAREWRGSWRA